MSSLLLLTKLGSVVVLAAVSAGCSGQLVEQPTRGASPATAETETSEVQKPANGSSGMKVHIDPNTGKIIAPRSSPTPEVPPAVTATQPEPQPTLSPVPGGGVMIRLGDRFRSPLTATVDQENKVRFEHQPSPSHSLEQQQ